MTLFRTGRAILYPVSFPGAFDRAAKSAVTANAVGLSEEKAYQLTEMGEPPSRVRSAFDTEALENVFDDSPVAV